MRCPLGQLAHTQADSVGGRHVCTALPSGTPGACPCPFGPAGALQRCQSGAVSAGVSSVAVCAGCGPVGREEATVVGETSIEGARAGSVNRPAPPPGLRGIRLSPLPGGLARSEGEEKGGSFSPVPRSCGPVGGMGGAGSGAVSEGGQGDRG